MNFLPDEILRCLSSYLSAYDLALIWLSGARALNSKLARSVQHFSISAVQYFNMSHVRIPFARTHPFTGLQQVSIVFRSKRTAISATWILSLPEGLKSLHLAFADAFLQFVLPSSHVLASVLSSSQGKTGSDDPRDSILDVKRKFPSLELLTVHDSAISSSSGLKGWNSHQVRHLLDVMPMTLLQLSLSPQESIFFPDLWRSLPRSLQTFAVCKNHSMTSFDLALKDPSLDLSILPPNTTDLRMLVSQLHDLDWFGFPAHLKSLELHLSHVEVSQTLFERLPSTLESLTLSHFSVKGRILGLPTHLKRLHIGSQLEPSLAKHLLRNLPPTLLELTTNRILAQPHLDTIPTTLTKLRIILDACPPSFNCLSRLSNLTNLSVIQSKTKWAGGPGAATLTEPPIEFDCFLPKLKILQWSSIKTTLNSEFLKNLPPCLESLTLDDTITHPSAVGQHFPDGLTTLHMGELIDPCNWIMGLNQEYDSFPNRKDGAKLSPFKSGQSAVNEDCDNQMTGENQRLASCLWSYPLPGGLKSLLMVPPCKLTKFFVSRLPRTLTSLVLRTNTLATDGSVEQLGPQLKTLSLRGEHPFTDANIGLLPRSLESLELFSARFDESFTDDCVSDLPKGLKVLSLSNTRLLTIKGVAGLPRSIRSLSLGHISFPEVYPFKNLFEAMQALPPSVDLHCRVTPADIKLWAETALEKQNNKDSSKVALSPDN